GWRGEVSGADLAAMFAATAGLPRLHEAMEDRRLEAQIAQSGQSGAEWRVTLSLGLVAAPLWLADALVALAGAFYDAETQPHSGRASSISPYVHDLVASLLLPVEDIVADVTAALADPRRPTTLILPVLVGPGGDIADYDLPRSPSVAYMGELARGARGVHTSAAATLATARAATSTSSSPAWLEAGLRRLDGDVQAAGARLDMAEVRSTAAQATRGENPQVLEALCRDLWGVIRVAIVAGQLSADPHLMPEAAAAAQAGAHSAASVRTLQSPPALAPRQVDALPFPWIDAGGAPLARRQDTPTATHPATIMDDVQLPRIGEGTASPHETTSAAPIPDAPLPGSSSPTVSFPTIGELSMPATQQPEAAKSSKPAAQAPRSRKSPTDARNDEPTVTLPEIG
ncbi:MAG: hypothetical protein ACRDHE_03990, partial [Ktedonobacterales bacterium]